MLEVIIGMACSGVIASLCTYIVGKRIAENMMINAEDRIFEILRSEEGQKWIFSIGAMLGNGIKSGVGLTKKSGKFGLQDLLMQIAGQYLQGKIGTPTESEPTRQGPYRNPFK